MTTPSPLMIDLAPGSPLPVAMTEDPDGERKVIIGAVLHTLDQARDHAASVLAAIKVGEQRGLWLVVAGT